ncbi:DUF6492 family protein [Sphingobacterium detergens]|uniref:Glycosyl transferase family 8 n=1 Tax=Sphingobacterium detergens TaxID=1145106 RepID=A0A420AXQ5_SPHD1|nr:DUF6492 family protein [Sphingobacterium detergens]RKE49215.1 hypothetical protein DFQ12_3326 [Sphingobacterium detergens]
MDLKKEKKCYDLAICVGPQHIEIAKIVINQAKRFFQTQQIYVITNSSHFEKFQSLNLTNLVLINENELFDQFNFRSVTNFLKQKINNGDRAGWYFQQFLKLEISKIIQSDYYLIWDADTIPLKPIDFFNKEDKVLIHKSEENHQPYFETLEHILGLKKTVNYSFISEHFMVQTKLMQNMLLEISKKAGDQAWPYYILENIATKDLALSGFSEYETYGNFLNSTYPDDFRLRNSPSELLNTTRNGSMILGTLPNTKDLDFLEVLGLHYATFEIWQDINPKQIKANKRRVALFFFLEKIPLMRSLNKLIIKNFRKTYSLPQPPY